MKQDATCDRQISLEEAEKVLEALEKLPIEKIGAILSSPIPRNPCSTVGGCEGEALTIETVKRIRLLR